MLSTSYLIPSLSFLNATTGEQAKQADTQSKSSPFFTFWLIFVLPLPVIPCCLFRFQFGLYLAMRNTYQLPHRAVELLKLLVCRFYSPPLFASGIGIVLVGASEPIVARPERPESSLKGRNVGSGANFLISSTIITIALMQTPNNTCTRSSV